MWRPPKDRYQHRRPYPTTRPRHNIPLKPDPLFHRPFNNLPQKPTPRPLPGFYFRAPPPTTRPAPAPARYAPDLVPPTLESLAKNPRFVHRPPNAPPSPYPCRPLTPSFEDPTSRIPGAYPASDPAIRVSDPPKPTDTKPDPQAPKHEEPATKKEESTNTRKRPRDSDEDDYGMETLKKRVLDEFGDDPLGKEELMLLKQLDALRLDVNYRNHLHQYRDSMERAARRDHVRARKQAQRDADVEKIVKMEEQAAEEERLQKAKEQERLRIQREERLRREAEARERERLRRAEEQARQLERERLERDAKEKLEAEMRAEVRRERIRKARELVPDPSSILAQFKLYDDKWAELKNNNQALPPLSFFVLPWPVLGPPATSPSDITLLRVREFVFHPLKCNAETKSGREQVRAETIKWHPDRFDTQVLRHVVDEGERLLAIEAASTIIRFLTEMLEEETQKERYGY